LGDKGALVESETIEKFGKYLLLTKLGTGGMAEVFLARPASTQAHGFVLAIKRVLPHVASDVNFVKMFHSEIQICMAFNHPHIVHIQDFGEENGQPYIAMDFIEGVNLKSLTAKFAKRGEFVPIGLAVSLAAQAASGLNYAHTFENPVTGQSLKVVHRDISPHNLILSYDGNLKIIDFGIAKATEVVNEESTQTGTLKGKLAYMSPEQVTFGKVDARSDVFSLGVVLWEMLTCRRLFSKSGDSDLTILERVRNCHTSVVAPSEINPEIPPELDRILSKALARNVDDRYATAAEFQKDLTSLLRTSFPHYNYAEVARTVKETFQAEMAEKRKSVRELNESAQEFLNSTSVVTRMTPPPSPIGRMLGGAQSSHPAPRSGDSTGIFLKRFGNKRVTRSHMIMFIFYIVSLSGLKLEEQYSFLDRLMLPTEMVREAKVQNAQNKRNAVAALNQQQAANMNAAAAPQSQAPMVAQQQALSETRPAAVPPNRPAASSLQARAMIPPSVPVHMPITQTAAVVPVQTARKAAPSSAARAPAAFKRSTSYFTDKKARTR
jgi:serine/threonine protein kinase